MSSPFEHAPTESEHFLFPQLPLKSRLAWPRTDLEVSTRHVDSNSRFFEMVGWTGTNCVVARVFRLRTLDREEMVGANGVAKIKNQNHNHAGAST